MNTKTVNRKKIIENQRKILGMQAIDRLVQIDKIREYVLQLIEYSISLEPGKEKDACRISARNTAKLIDFDNGLVYERGKPSYKKYFSMRANYGIKYPIPSILENDGNIAYLPGKRLSKEEVLYNEECIILSKLFKIAESEYNPEKIYTAFQSNLWLDKEEKWGDHKLRHELYFLHKIHKKLSVDIEEFGEQISLSILEEKISQVNLKASDILSAILDMNWVNIDKKNIPSCLQALENYVSRKGLVYGGIDKLNVLLDGGINITIICDLRKFEGNIEEELEYRLISLWDLLDKTRENRAIITNLSFSHTPST